MRRRSRGSSRRHAARSIVSLLILAAACSDSADDVGGGGPQVPDLGDAAQPGPDAADGASFPDALTPGPDGSAADAGDGSAFDDAALDASDDAPADASSDGSAPVTVTLSVSGNGTVTANGAPCTGSCQFPSGTTVTFAATPESGSFFPGWSGACTGPARTCQIVLNGDATLSATFAPIEHNLVFATSAIFTGALGGTTGADEKCKTAAATAGLEGTFVAALATSTQTLESRLGSARGFVRLDGAPIGDTVTDLFVDHRIYNAVLFDENGKKLRWGDDYAFTGPRGDGNSCADFTSTDGYAQKGEATGGPHVWLAVNPGWCDGREGMLRLYCVMTDKTAPVPPPARPAGSKLLFVSKASFDPKSGIDAAHAICEAEKPAESGTMKALLATTTAPATSFLSAGATYVRPDGVVIGTGAEIVAASNEAEAYVANTTLRSGPWQRADGSYTSGLVWTGADYGARKLDAPGKADTTCDDWAPSGTKGSQGLAHRTNYAIWYQTNTACTPAPVYCVEQ